MNAKKLKSKMVLYDDTNATLADALGISPQRCSAKINETNGAEFTKREIGIMIARYHLTHEEVIDIFFT